MLPFFKTLFVVVIATCTLNACDWLRGGSYIVRDIDTTIAPKGLDRDQRDFFGIIDTVAQRHGMRSVPCGAAVAEKTTCRSYEIAKGAFLEGFLDLKANEYVISVYEWNVSNRSPLALDIEAEVLKSLRARFGDKVVAERRNGV